MSEVVTHRLPGQARGNAWTLSGQHTGLTDLPLRTRWRNARRLEERLRGVSFARCLPARCRSTRTCELAALGAVLKSTETARMDYAI